MDGKQLRGPSSTRPVPFCLHITVMHLSILRKLLLSAGWLFMAGLAMLIAAIASRYLSLNPASYFDRQREVYSAHSIGLFAHIAGGVLALSLGPFQFVSRLRQGRWKRVHRWLGRIYLIAVLLSGFGGLYLVSIAYGGPLNQLGFGALDLFWLVSCFKAYQSIRGGDVQAHRRWMVRNYAATFGAVTLRLWLAGLTVAGFDFLRAYQLVAWLSWIPNLLVAECWLRFGPLIRDSEPSPKT